MDKKRVIEMACEAYCKCCDTKECEDLGEFCGEVPCSWLEKFKKELKKKIKLQTP